MAAKIAGVKKQRRRAPKGTGCITQRSDGRWQASMLVDVGGKKVRRYATGKSRLEAAEKLEALKTVEVGQSRKESAPKTVREFAETYLEECRLNLKVATYELYETLWRVHLMPVFGAYELATVTPMQIEQFMVSKRHTGLSARTVQLLGITLRSVFDKAERLEVIDRNPMDRVAKTKSKPKEADPLTAEELGQILAAPATNRLRAMVIVAATCGLRVGELTGLDWSDIDFESQTLCVRRTLQRTRTEGLRVGTPKTAGSARTIHIPKMALVALAGIRSNVEASTGFVFVTNTGEPVEPRRFLRSFQALCDRAGVRRRRVHDLRHTAATLLLGAGVPLKVVSDLLGHSTIKLTADCYSHVMPSMRRDAADAMDKVFEKTAI